MVGWDLTSLACSRNDIVCAIQIDSDLEEVGVGDLPPAKAVGDQQELVIKTWHDHLQLNLSYS
jgi:hypothetical protein